MLPKNEKNGRDPAREANPREESPPIDELFEEFSITELEDRLEFVMKCDNNCSCPPSPPH